MRAQLFPTLPSSFAARITARAPAARSPPYREDFGILIALQLLNACIGFAEAFKAGNAVDALKSKLAAKVRISRAPPPFPCAFCVLACPCHPARIRALAPRARALSPATRARPTSCATARGTRRRRRSWCRAT